MAADIVIKARFSLATAGGFEVVASDETGVVYEGAAASFLDARAQAKAAIPEDSTLSISFDRPLLVIDVEATCDEGGRIPRASMEVIEIGAVLVNGESLESLGELTTFVRPKKTPQLTPFCTKLTSITQRDVDHAPPFGEAVSVVDAFLAERGVYWPIFASWGAYDREQLAQDCGHHRVALPFTLRESDHVNLKTAFTAALGDHVESDRKKLGVQGALSRVGLTFDGTHHRGVDDARNITRLLPWVLGRRSDLAPPSKRSRR